MEIDWAGMVRHVMSRHRAASHDRTCRGKAGEA